MSQPVTQAGVLATLDSQKNVPGGVPGIGEDGTVPGITVHRTGALSALEALVPADGEIVVIEESGVKTLGVGDGEGAVESILLSSRRVLVAQPSDSTIVIAFDRDTHLDITALTVSCEISIQTTDPTIVPRVGDRLTIAGSLGADLTLSYNDGGVSMAYNASGGEAGMDVLIEFVCIKTQTWAEGDVYVPRFATLSQFNWSEAGGG